MKLSLVVPCFNEEGNIRDFYNEARRYLKDYEYELIFINDGSEDHTFRMLKEIYHEQEENMVIVNFSRNFGKESAMYAGLKKSTGDYVTIIDADLQQPLRIVKEMVDFLDNNPEYDEVATYQAERKEGMILSAFKSVFYRIINKMSDVEFYRGASDFRTFRKCVVHAILEISEYNRFSKGIFSWVGFNIYYKEYEAEERNSGNSSWSFRKLTRYAIDGMVSFSTAPLKLATLLGVGTSLLALVYMLFVIVQKVIWEITIPGYPTIVVLILLIGGVQLSFLGIIGEYLARVHMEVKHRPIYIEKECLDYKADNANPVTPPL